MTLQGSPASPVRRCTTPIQETLGKVRIGHLTRTDHRHPDVEPTRGRAQRPPTTPCLRGMIRHSVGSPHGTGEVSDRTRHGPDQKPAGQQHCGWRAANRGRRNERRTILAGWRRTSSNYWPRPESPAGCWSSRRGAHTTELCIPSVGRSPRTAMVSRCASGYAYWRRTPPPPRGRPRRGLAGRPRGSILRLPAIRSEAGTGGHLGVGAAGCDRPR